jgi:hypothetical protein
MKTKGSMKIKTLCIVASVLIIYDLATGAKDETPAQKKVRDYYTAQLLVATQLPQQQPDKVDHRIELSDRIPFPYILTVVDTVTFPDNSQIIHARREDGAIFPAVAEGNGITNGDHVVMFGPAQHPHSEKTLEDASLVVVKCCVLQ